MTYEVSRPQEPDSPHLANSKALDDRGRAPAGRRNGGCRRRALSPGL
jgi:hypothetical protein